MDTVTLQVPMSRKLRDSAAAVAGDYGFSSLQELARFLFTKVAKRSLSITIQEPIVKLSRKNEKRYLQIEQDFRANRNVHQAKGIDDFLHQLNS